MATVGAEAIATLSWRQVRAGPLDIDIEKLKRKVVVDMAQEKEADRTREDWRELFIENKPEYEFDNAMVSNSTSDDKASKSPEASKAEEGGGSNFDEDQVVKGNRKQAWAATQYRGKLMVHAISKEDGDIPLCKRGRCGDKRELRRVVARGDGLDGLRKTADSGTAMCPGCMESLGSSRDQWQDCCVLLNQLL